MNFLLNFINFWWMLQRIPMEIPHVYTHNGTSGRWSCEDGFLRGGQCCVCLSVLDKKRGRLFASFVSLCRCTYDTFSSCLKSLQMSTSTVSSYNYILYRPVDMLYYGLLVASCWYLSMSPCREVSTIYFCNSEICSWLPVRPRKYACQAVFGDHGQLQLQVRPSGETQPSTTWWHH